MPPSRSTPSGHITGIPQADHGDREDQARERRLVVGVLSPQLVWFVTAMTEEGNGGPTRRAGGAFRVTPRLPAGDCPADTDLTRQREFVDAFLAASRGGDFDALLAVLDPDVVLRADTSGVAPGTSKVVRGAAAV